MTRKVVKIQILPVFERKIIFMKSPKTFHININIISNKNINHIIINLGNSHAC